MTNSSQTAAPQSNSEFNQADLKGWEPENEEQWQKSGKAIASQRALTTEELILLKDKTRCITGHNLAC
jgi:hypothetical protein